MRYRMRSMVVVALMSVAPTALADEKPRVDHCLRGKVQIYATTPENWQTCGEISLATAPSDPDCKAQQLKNGDKLHVKKQVANGKTKMTLTLVRAPEAANINDLELNAETSGDNVVYYHASQGGTDFYVYREKGNNVRDWRIELFATNEPGETLEKCKRHRPKIGVTVQPDACPQVREPQALRVKPDQGATGGGGGNLVLVDGKCVEGPSDR